MSCRITLLPNPTLLQLGNQLVLGGQALVQNGLVLAEGFELTGEAMVRGAQGLAPVLPGVRLVVRLGLIQSRLQLRHPEENTW